MRLWPKCREASVAFVLFPGGFASLFLRIILEQLSEKGRGARGRSRTASLKKKIKK